MVLPDASLPEVSTPIALAALVVMQAFALIRSQTKGNKVNGSAKVRPEDAVDFWTLQQGLDRKLDEVLRLLRERRR